MSSPPMISTVRELRPRPLPAWPLPALAAGGAGALLDEQAPQTEAER